MSRSLRRMLPLLAIALCPACASDFTVLVVNVDARPGVHDEQGQDPFDLEVTFKSDQDPVRPQTILAPPAGSFFPNTGSRKTTFSIIANGRQGTVQVTALARTAAGRPLAAGKATATLLAGQTVETALVLFPSDFQVNTKFANSQIFSFSGPLGRQVAADSQGNFVCVWEDLECDKGDRCDLTARLFDASAKARLNAELGSSDEFRVNPASDTYDHPVVAVQPQGEFLVAWIAASGVGVPPVLEARSFLADGRPNPASGTKITLNKATGKGAASPDLAVLTDKSYVACWAENTATGHQILCRELDVNGTTLPGAGGIRDAFVAHKLDTGKSAFTILREGGVERAVPVAVAAGPANGFMVVWSENCGVDCWNARGRIFNPNAQAFGNIIDLSAKPTSKTGLFDVAGLSYGFIVAWTDTISTDAANGSDIRVRRFAITGQALADDYTINTSVIADQLTPTIAALPDDSLLVAWASADETSDPVGGIRGRRILANGLPVGSDFALNTTTPQKQEDPGLAPVGREAFVLVYKDSSAAGLDTKKSGIRGRLLYPNYNVADGQVGARCGPGLQNCGGGLLCSVVELPGNKAEQRCVSGCTAVGAPCANGGRCLKLAGGNNHICRYDIPRL